MPSVFSVQQNKLLTCAAITKSNKRIPRKSIFGLINKVTNIPTEVTICLNIQENGYLTHLPSPKLPSIRLSLHQDNFCSCKAPSPHQQNSVSRPNRQKYQLVKLASKLKHHTMTMEAWVTEALFIRQSIMHTY